MQARRAFRRFQVSPTGLESIRRERSRYAGVIGYVSRLAFATVPTQNRGERWAAKYVV
ncbi:hypothetical protein RISK_003961 [Rhodopirellula islandica]|uniref:Uncharacterized protein n=1 Tax=Rhodopirellula islandica TaxID=595434 RepID=A0A0J1BBH4_RHOIS|nr:hypothetical protein RISK_003961 [Rhodopirellula islandica]